MCQTLWFLVSKVLFMKGFYLDDATWLLIVCFISTIDNYCELFDLSLHAFTLLSDLDCVGSMSLQKLFCYHLPTRGRVGVKLGDADTSPTYL